MTFRSVVSNVLLLVTLLALAGSYCGLWHPAGDSLAVFRPVFAAVAVLLGLMTRSRAGAFAALTGLVALAPILWMMRAVPQPQDGLVVYQKNLFFGMQDHKAIIADIRDSRANIVLLEELSQDNLPVIWSLRDSHPYQQVCEAHAVGAVAILSDMPFQNAPTCPDTRGAAVARVVTPYGPLSVAAIHLHWPWPFGQAAQMQALLPHLRNLPRPVLIGGDFNMVPWSHLDRVVTGATDTHVAGPIRPSLTLKRVYPMPIDQLLIPEGWSGQVQMRERLGSDHRGVLLRLSPLPQASGSGQR